MARGRYNQPVLSRRSAIVRRSAMGALALALILFLLGLNGRQPLGSIQAPAEGGAARILTVMSMPLRGLENLTGGLTAHFGTVKENKRLREELAGLTNVDSQNRALQEQVRYLEGVLNTNIDTGETGQRIAARAVSEANGPFVYSALINAGARKGVRDGDAVMTLNGLYGRVVRTGSSSARVLLLTDLNSRIAVMSERSRARAILTGNNSQTPTLEFRGEGDWQTGDRIVTSGDGGVLRPGLAIGIVKPAGGTLSADLFTLKNPVDWVWVSPHSPALAPEADPQTQSAQNPAGDPAPQSSETASESATVEGDAP